MTPQETSDCNRDVKASFAAARGSGARSYGTIVADPPWHYDDFCQIHSKAGRTVKPLPYGSMTVKEICALPVKEIAASDSRLFLWTTNKCLPDSFGVMAAWGFDYKQTLIWHKVGNPSPWGGSVAPNHAVFLDLVETVSPGPYVELFCREARLGWDRWGNESASNVGLVLPNP